MTWYLSVKALGVSMSEMRSLGSIDSNSLFTLQPKLEEISGDRRCQSTSGG